MYCGLSWFGVRRGLHWARVAVEASAFVGFASFFLFLGFGYFDPFPRVRHGGPAPVFLAQ